MCWWVRDVMCSYLVPEEGDDVLVCVGQLEEAVLEG